MSKYNNFLNPVLALMLLVLLFLMVLNPISQAGSAGLPQEPPPQGEGEYGWWPLTWGVYDGVGNVSAQSIQSWHQIGSLLLQTADGEDDVEVAASLYIQGSEEMEEGDHLEDSISWDWSCQNGTANITELRELNYMAFLMPFDCLVVESIEIGDRSKRGAFNMELEKIIIVKYPYDSTLVHEVGHWAELIDITSDSERIMYQWGNYSKWKVSENCPEQQKNEREHFEVGKPGAYGEPS